MSQDYPPNVRSFAENLALFALDRFVDTFNDLVKSSVMDNEGNWHNAEAEEMYAYFAKAFAKTCALVEEGEVTDSYIFSSTRDAGLNLKKKLQQAQMEEHMEAFESELDDDEQEVVEKNMPPHFFGMIPNPESISEIYNRLELVEAMVMILHQQLMDKNPSDDTKGNTKAH